jgi:hypothetical protein
MIIWLNGVAYLMYKNYPIREIRLGNYRLKLVHFISILYLINHECGNDENVIVAISGIATIKIVVLTVKPEFTRV